MPQVPCLCQTIASLIALFWCWIAMAGRMVVVCDATLVESYRAQMTLNGVVCGTVSRTIEHRANIVVGDFHQYIPSMVPSPCT